MRLFYKFWKVFINIIKKLNKYLRGRGKILLFIVYMVFYWENLRELIENSLEYFWIYVDWNINNKYGYLYKLVVFLYIY